MNDRCYVGIDNTDENEWLVALLGKDTVILSKPFKNTPAGLGDLVRFVTEHGIRPKICLKPSHPSLKLINTIGNIPDVEVVLMSNAGLKMHLAWLPKVMAASYIQNGPCQAQLLAYCAERVA
ncbi:MAG: hypothetical protein PHH59_07860 [Methylovulum sp.]|uniref:hypothetical protein n=1 Tax=Methylovulum sp. TaxID=1916980 RepID=UPI00262CEB5E|nr:hypothetical protein [Methylovulum sp.]MDD2723921.1 hypothetical protein [Methylovulum sp.]MDD5126213.1 hypothetical protein [Methylovulum sp.]